MTRVKKLSGRQLAVIEELFNGKLDEQKILDKYKVGRNLYNKWLADETFTEHFDRCIASSYRQSAALIARNAPKAVNKLVQLTESDKAETARKACLDIISIPMSMNKNNQQPQRAEDSDNPPALQLSEQTASRLLAALAGQENSHI